MRNVAVDSSLGAIYVTKSQLYENSSSTVVLSAYGAQSLTLTGTLAFPLIGYPNVTNLVRWGGFAFIAAGPGLTDKELYTIVAAVPQLASSASSVDFGSIAQGASSSVQAITLTNTGTAALSISSIVANGDFSQTNTCGGTLLVNAACQVSIVFTPTAIGQRTGTLTVSDNATGSPQTVTLSGTGVVQALTLGVGTGGSTTTTVASGQAATYNLSLSGSPGFSGTVAVTCSGAPQNATCSIVPFTVTLPAGGSANSAVTVSTSVQTAYLNQRSHTFVAGLGLFSLFSLPIFLLIRKRTPTQIRILCAASALLITLLPVVVVPKEVRNL